MITHGFRNILTIVAMLVLVGGPILAVLGYVTSAGAAEPAHGLALRDAVWLFFGSLVAGGLMRLLISIDARLEARG